MEGIKYTTVSEIAGPLMIVEGVKEVGYGEIVRIIEPSKKERLVLELLKYQILINLKNYQFNY